MLSKSTELLLKALVSAVKAGCETADSIEIGAQTSGRVKVYGDLDVPATLDRKLANATELLLKHRPAFVNGGQ